MRLLLKALGWAMIVFAGLGAAVEIDNARSGKSHDVAATLAMIAVFGGGGALLVRKARRMKGAGDPEALAAAAIEQRVLTSARRLRGRVTAVSAAADGSLTVEQARGELERLAKENACLMDVSPDGLVVFRFPEFETPESRPA